MAATSTANAKVDAKTSTKTDARKVHFSESQPADSDDSMEDDSDGGVRAPGRGEDSDDGSEQDRDDRDDMDVDEEDEEERLAREEREAAFRAGRVKDQEEVDDYEDKVLRPQMGSKPVIGLSASTPTPDSPDTSQSKNKAMAASIKAGLGLSNDAGSTTSSRDNSPRIHQRSRSGNSGSMSFFKNRVGFQGTDSKDNSPSPRPGSPAAASSPKPEAAFIAPVKVNKDYGAFSAKGSGFGLKMLEKMGWKKGYGLGAGGSGIVEPIQTKLRPVKMGIGFKGFKEKTEQDRAEEKRRGLVVSSDEEEQPDKRKSKGILRKESENEIKSDGWKKTSSRSSRKGPKIEYKTAAEIQQEIETGDLPMAQIQTQKILDMTGKTVCNLTAKTHILLLFCVEESTHGSKLLILTNVFILVLVSRCGN